MDEKQIARFWRNVDKRGPDECWEWRRVRDRKGYGRVRIGGGAGKTMFAHRVAISIARGLPPLEGFEGLTLHACDNPACCNPAHLSTGTHADNCADMDRKGRRVVHHPVGERNVKAKLSADLVRAIRSQPTAHRGELATMYGVSVATIASVRSGATWQHIT